jgi:hypothetical protein
MNLIGIIITLHANGVPQQVAALVLAMVGR